MPLSLIEIKLKAEELKTFLNPFLGIYELWWLGSEWFIVTNKLMNNSEPLVEVLLGSFPSHLM